jgi:hypothetical protein
VEFFSAFEVIFLFSFRMFLERTRDIDELVCFIFQQIMLGTPRSFVLVQRGTTPRRVRVSLAIS